MIKVFKILYWIVNVVIITALLVVHFVLKERSFSDSLRYYTLPLLIIITIVLLLSIFLSKRKYNLILAGILLIIWLSRSFKIHIPESVNDSDVEVVFWNASRDNGFDEAFNLNESIPDVLVLVESKKNDFKAIQQKNPKYFFYKLKREIYIFSKTEIQIDSEHTSNYNSTVIKFKTRDINFYAIDVTGSTDVPRTWELDFVNKLIETKEKTIVLGDFNVPFESKYLNTIKTNFNHAFNEKGNGFRETWFWNIPLLSLDHIWVSKDLKILKTEKIGTFKSDHSMLKTYIRN
ncbi:endonuclease/exonuclease/phosphatase family protein [Mariniflexile litorale]|uniref:Endonuclease/exonuclease/phosphatase family protein n=1 Tax=Mariniflexile litorale TaxID=3045158 RepID=A0AAU7EK39_9FLAO|nr:endonuclease/exonuclease/phosphatase family protein [Mariniflexile sp. KMM 9835]MDQ8213212.1 endonuclease/exonuclease/phosphatase family protein [Mariniflexile sp. KMM 9835]